MTSLDELLQRARSRLCRVAPEQAPAALEAGAWLVDIRGDGQIARDGLIPCALIIPRNVLEWRLCPSSEHRHPDAPGPEDHVILVCDEGYQSSLAAAVLQELGLTRATDLIGGFQAWRAAGLPIVALGASRTPGRPPARERILGMLAADAAPGH